MKKFQISFILLILVFLCVACSNLPGSESDQAESVVPTSPVSATDEDDLVDSGPIHPKAVTAVVFVDENVNGRFDPDEPTIPDTLIVSQYNVYGDFFRHGALTDAEGRANLSADYTNFYEIAVVPPCEFEATTAVKLNANEVDGDGVLVFGFRPEKTELGMADIQVHLWQDDYEDGVMGEAERPLTDVTIHFNPDISWIDRAEHYDGLLSVQTDENGIAVTSLGNGCDIVWIDPLVEGRFTKIRPSVTYDEGQTVFAYGDGLLDVRMGITNNEIVSEPASLPINQFAFANGSPNHPEGLGEWQLLLDRAGYFTLKHIMHDEEKDYGVTTLLPAETERLWQLIAAADLANVSSSTSEAVPDTPMYIFTLISTDGDQVITIWATDAQDNQAIQDLLDGLTEVIKSHTGEEIVIH